MNPFQVASQMTGLPTKKPKPKHVRGNKGSGKPFASHIGAIQKAHGSGDLAGLKSHALNLANAVHKHLTSVQTPPDETDIPGMAQSQDEPEVFPAMAQPSKQMSVKSTPPGTPTSNSRATLAKLAMSRRK